jgi:hypothetical protein
MHCWVLTLLDPFPPLPFPPSRAATEVARASKVATENFMVVGERWFVVWCGNREQSKVLWQPCTSGNNPTSYRPRPRSTGRLKCRPLNFKTARQCFRNSRPYLNLQRRDLINSGEAEIVLSSQKLVQQDSHYRKVRASQTNRCARRQINKSLFWWRHFKNDYRCERALQKVLLTDMNGSWE